MIKKTIFLLTIIFSLNVSGQNSEQRIMTSFVPKSQAYDIYYPKRFSLIEDIEGIVLIYDSVSKLSLTISAYSIEKGLEDKKLIEMLNDFIKSFFLKELKEEDWNSYNTKFDVLVETKFTVKQTNWVWYGIADDQRLVTISINKDTVIEQDELNLVKFMIDNLIIY